MATRNRTMVYRKHRDACKSARAPLSLSASDTFGGPVIEMVSGSFTRSNHASYAPLNTNDLGPSSSDAFTIGLPPVWVDDSEEITFNIQKVRDKMGELAKAHSKALMPTFGDNKGNQRAVEMLTHDITDLLRNSEKRLQRLSTRGGASEESSIRKNVQRSLATDLQNLSMELRRKQSTYLKRLQQQKEGQDGVDLEFNMNGNMSRFDEDDELGGMGFDEHQTIKLKEGQHVSAEREREIQQVLGSVNDLAQIMKDLSALVIDQGTIVDRIDYNIQNVSTTVEEGYKQLQKAERTQREGAIVKCATILLILCFIMIVLLVLKNILF
ncbi:unnamed protein product [Cochlearia groenlandica]